MGFEELANEHKDAVYRQMLRVCGNREDAEDVLIDALLRAWRHLDQLKDPTAFRGWLAQIARRVCWDLKDREKLMPVLQLSTMPQGGESVPGTLPAMEASLDAARMKDVLRQALDELPELYRDVYTMRDLDDLPGEQVAQRLGISIATMKSRLHRARARLRERLDREWKGTGSD